MEFLKDLFTEALDWDAFSKAVSEKKMKLADLSSGTYVERDKFDKVNRELADKKKDFDTLNRDFEELKQKGASAEDYKTKFEQLQADVAEREKAEREAKEKAEREANIASRYEAAAVGKDGKPLEWSHEAVKADYLRKFTDALSDKAYEGKSDTDIFNDLIKDDPSATRVPFAKDVFDGAGGVGDEFDEAKINAIMGIA